MGASTSVSSVQESFEDDVYSTASSSSSFSSVQESFEDDVYSTPSSASSLEKIFKYDVFLSFRGGDTRKTFVDHLYYALDDKGIITYKDDVRIKKGERISDQLLRSIDESRFHIIVFSKDYASSSWCLEELVKIMECKKTMEHTVYPVFYDVEPTEVRHQSGAFEEAFKKHAEKEGCGRWRLALEDAAALAGWDVKTIANGHEAKFIRELVKDITLKLHDINLSVDEKLVGMKTRVMKVVTDLESGSDVVQMLGIKGIGGGGKTTLARAVFDHMSISFEGKSFVENVREVSKGSSSGLKKLQKRVLKDVLNEKNIDVPNVSDGKHMMKKRMCSIKVLIVLDDVDHIDQLEALAGGRNWFKPRSKIIVTTRDEQVLVAHRANFFHDVNMNFIHNVDLLTHKEALCLFSRCAFGGEIPVPGYEELSRKVVHYADGLPLTIKVLGSDLCCKSEREWENALERLKTIPLKQTLDILELSYNGLDDDYKEIFLDVACLLKGETKEEAIKILESCGHHGDIGLSVLEKKCLITISDIEGLRLHDHLEEMAKNIVRRLHPNEPKRHKRLWIKDEIEDILDKELGTEATLSIKLNCMDLQPSIIMKGLRKMNNLRFLHVQNELSKWYVNEASLYLPDSLQYLHWPCYRVPCLPKTFHANSLVYLKMDWSDISELWEEGQEKVLSKLRFLDLKFSKLRTFDLGLTPDLERLDITGCNDFVEVHFPAECRKLKFLSLGGSKLSNLMLGRTPYLETLDLGGCHDFKKLYMCATCLELKVLNLSGSKLSNFNIELAPNLVELYLEECKELVELCIPFKCPTLKFLNLSCSKLRTFDLGLTPHLERLDLRECNDFVELHIPVQCPINLRFLRLSGSKLSNLDLGLAPHIETLDLGGCYDFVKLHMPIECSKLKFLNLSGSKLSNLNIELTPKLVELYLENCNHFVKLNMPLRCQYLKLLNLSGSKLSVLNLGHTPSLERLDLKQCDYLQEIQAPVGCLEKLVYLDLSGCLRFKCFSVNSGYGLSRVDSLAKLQLTVEPLIICPLHPNNNSPKFQFNCSYCEPLPFSSGNIEKLISFGLCACTNLESVSENICGLQRLGELTLEGSTPEAPKNLYKLEYLEKLTLSMKEINHLPDTICMLKHLKSLELKSCSRLECLPKDLCKLESLEKLHITDCVSLQDIPDSICMIKSLKYLHLPYNALVEKLPEELGHLECLKELNIEGTGITHLPHSILQLNGLCIVWSRGMLKLYGFTPLVSTSRYTATYYIRC